MKERDVVTPSLKLEDKAGWSPFAKRIYSKVYGLAIMLKRHNGPVYIRNIYGGDTTATDCC